jgi:hypothetical protein
MGSHSIPDHAMRLRTAAALSLVLALTVLSAAAAQVSPPPSALLSADSAPTADLPTVDEVHCTSGQSLPAGTLVRLTLRGPYRPIVQGRLVEADSAGLTLAVGGDGLQRRFARDSVRLLDVADGTTRTASRVGRGARIGFYAGAAATALLALAGGSGDDDGAEGLVIIGTELTAATTLLGAVLVGRGLSPRRWRPAPIPVRAEPADASPGPCTRASGGSRSTRPIRSVPRDPAYATHP